MEDVKNRKDIESIINEFYKKLFSDARINYLFTEIAKTNLDNHLPSLCDFWENILFGQPFYNKNVMQLHKEINSKSQFTKEHFEIWMNYFKNTIDEKYSGEIAQNMKDRAHAIAYVMKTKILNQ